MVVCSDSNDGRLDRYVAHAHECLLFLFFQEERLAGFVASVGTYTHAVQAADAAPLLDPSSVAYCEKRSIKNTIQVSLSLDTPAQPRRQACMHGRT
jgi:hypothetical protein